MSMKPLQGGLFPLGQFDMLDSEVTSIKGGEVVAFDPAAVFPGTELAAEDANDGYSGQANLRTVITKTLTSANPPAFLADEGTTGYGTLFGTVVGATVGKVVLGGTALGPHSMAGSGKITLWDKPGLYSVSLDAVDTTAVTGLVPTNTGLNAGDPLRAVAATGLLTPASTGAFSNAIVARFIEFGTDRSLVSTPKSLVAALNSPNSTTASQAGAVFEEVVIYWSGWVGS